MIRNIVVIDDDTEVSDKALEFACEIAKPCGACITFLHIIDQIENPDTMIFGDNKELIEKAKLMNLRPSSMEDTWLVRTQQKIEKLTEQHIESDCKCLTGDIAEKILEYERIRILKIYEFDKTIFVLINSNTQLEHTVDNILGYYYDLDEIPKSLF